MCLAITINNDAKPPAADQTKKLDNFQLGIDLMYCNREGKNVPVVYKGARANGLLHAARFDDGEKLTFHDSNLQLLEQPDFSHIPKSPLDYRNEVGTGLLLEEGQALARLSTLSPLQQELTSWHR